MKATKSLQRAPVQAAVLDDGYSDACGSFMLSLRARNASVRTLAAYGAAVTQFGMYLDSQGRRPCSLRDLTADDIRGFEQALGAAGKKPSTVNNRHRGLHAFFTWALQEGDEIDVNPMDKVKPPIVKDVRLLSI